MISKLESLNKKKTIKIFMLHLGHGGIEKQTISMANGLIDRYNIEIISFYKLDDKPAFDIDKNIKIKYLYNGKPNREEFINSVKKFRFLHAFKEGIKSLKILFLKKNLVKKEILLNDADIYFSTRTEYGELLSKYASKDKMTLTQEHNFFDDMKYKNRIVKGYKNLDYIVVINEFSEKMYKDWFKDSNVKIVRIPNILEYIPSSNSNLNNNAVIAVGRLNYIKDFSSLIDVINIAVKDNPTLKLYLLGDGEEKELLKEKIKNYNIESNVIMPGFVSSSEVENYMLKSDIYIMTSIKECFPMVLLEAYSCGLPAISFDILAGPKEIVKENKTGYLIKDRNINEMAHAINDLLKDTNKLKLFSENALIESKKYNVNNIITKWYDILK